jgi:hypothetical protein
MMFLCSIRRIPMMLLAVTAFDAKYTAMAFQPRPQRAARVMTTLRSQHDSDDERLTAIDTKLAVLDSTAVRTETDIKEMKSDIKNIKEMQSQMILS